MTILILFLFFLYAVGLQTSIALMEMASWSLFGLALVRFVQQKAPWQRLKTGAEIPFLIFFLVVLLGAVRADVPLQEKIDIVGWMRWMLLLYGFFFLLQDLLKPKWEKGALVWFGVTIALAVISFIQFQWGIEVIRKDDPLDVLGSHWRAQGAFNMCLTFAYVIGIVGMMALGGAACLWRQGRKKVSVYLYAVYAAAGLCILFSLTRGAWISYAGGSAAIAVAFSPRRGIKLVAFGALVAALLVWRVPVLHDRFATMFNGDYNSNVERMRIWTANVMMFEDHPIFGVGLDQNSKLAPSYYVKMGQPANSFTSHAHNNFIQYLSCTGIVGLAAYLWFCGFFLWAAWTLYRRANWEQPWFKIIGLGSFGAQIHFHLGGLTECNFSDGEVTHNLIFVWALTIAALYQLNRVKSDTAATSAAPSR